MVGRARANRGEDTKRVTAVAVLADGSRALSSSDDCTLRLWDLATGETLRTLEGHTESPASLASCCTGARRQAP
jgi:WD40 repeat protein